MRLLQWLRDDVTLGHLHIVAVRATVWLARHHLDDFAQALLPHCLLRRAVNAEPAEFHIRRRLAAAELDAAVAHQVEHRDALGDARGVIERRPPEPRAMSG